MLQVSELGMVSELYLNKAAKEKLPPRNLTSCHEANPNMPDPSCMAFTQISPHPNSCALPPASHCP